MGVPGLQGAKGPSTGRTDGQMGAVSPCRVHAPSSKGPSATQLPSLVEGPADLLEKSEIQTFMGHLLIKYYTPHKLTMSSHQPNHCMWIVSFGPYYNPIG